MDDGIAASARLIGEIRGNAFAMSAARRRRPVVLVVGAEDSGALLCSRVLPVLGIRMTGRGTDEGGTGRSPLHGAAGGPGRSQVAALHDRILALFGSGDADAVDDLQMPVSWWADPRVAAIRREIADLVNRGIGTGRVGFYDPCTMRLMPVWNQIAKELKLAPKIIHCLRNPAQLARVLHGRDGMAPGLAEYRWFVHTLEFFRHARKADICTIEYDEWFVDSAINLQKLRRFLALPDEPAELDSGEAVSEIIEAERGGSDIAPAEARQPLIRSVYRLARRLENDAGARDQLQHIAGQLLSFQQLHAAGRSGALPTEARRTSETDVTPLGYCLSPASFWQPEDVVPSAWHEHASFAFWLTEALRPGVFVELGTHHGFSYLAFCQAVQRLGGITKCYAVDTWEGDEHAGFYGDEVLATLNQLHDRRYSGFSRLIRSTFDEALRHFADGSVDLLHIDGRHGYDDVVHDFESWLPKLSDRAVVLLHDINVRERGFGVWQFWAELQARYRCFEFAHGYGLGVVQVGRVLAEPLRPLFDSSEQDKAVIAQAYAQLGRLATASHELAEARTALQERDARVLTLEAERAAARDGLANAENWARDREATIEFMRAEMGRLQEAAAAARLRDEELHRIRQRLAELHAVIAGAESSARDPEATIDVVRAEMGRLRDAAAASRLREDELQRIRGQLAELREVVGEAERQAEERSAGQAAMHREIAPALEAARRSSEAAARDAAVSERATLADEIKALTTELADSRQIGRAALQALAASNPGFTYREPRLGWRQTLRRLFSAARRR